MARKAPKTPLKVSTNKYAGCNVPIKVQKIIEGNVLAGEGRALSDYQKKVLQRAIEEKRAEAFAKKRRNTWA